MSKEQATVLDKYLSSEMIKDIEANIDKYPSEVTDCLLSKVGDNVFVTEQSISNTKEQLYSQLMEFMQFWNNALIKKVMHGPWSSYNEAMYKPGADIVDEICVLLSKGIIALDEDNTEDLSLVLYVYDILKNLGTNPSLLQIVFIVKYYEAKSGKAAVDLASIFSDEWIWPEIVKYILYANWMEDITNLCL